MTDIFVSKLDSLLWDTNESNSAESGDFQN